MCLDNLWITLDHRDINTETLIWDPTTTLYEQ
jgi:hypothetical protein